MTSIGRIESMVLLCFLSSQVQPVHFPLFVDLGGRKTHAEVQVVALGIKLHLSENYLLCKRTDQINFHARARSTVSADAC